MQQGGDGVRTLDLEVKVGNPALVLRQVALALTFVQRTESVDTRREREVCHNAVLLVTCRLDERVLEVDLDRELGSVHAAGPTPKSCPATDHVGSVVGDREEAGTLPINMYMLVIAPISPGSRNFTY